MYKYLCLNAHSDDSAVVFVTLQRGKETNGMNQFCYTVSQRKLYTDKRERGKKLKRERERERERGEGGGLTRCLPCDSILSL